MARPYLKDLPIPAESWAALWTVVVPNLRWSALTAAAGLASSCGGGKVAM